ncbi:DUF1549 and DUF1553 domain-containing protein [Verrucomicrobia bacterium]|nr:DUF1549 and DUF1553 domain-containing protein [Verrucomicrobiota bacterium]
MTPCLKPLLILLVCLTGCGVFKSLHGGEPDPHWAFQPIQKPKPPSNDSPAIDSFVQARLAGSDLAIQEEASPRILLRRLYFDMTGLPPSFEETQAFSKAPDREIPYQKAVESILASPRYGERWAQHWLDLVRYADTHGYEVNTERKNAWPYRDYVIHAFNADKPYDQFVFEQLAGDSTGQDAATGFLVAAPALLPGQIGKDEASKRLARQDALDEIIVSTGETFLGISIGCARCHDHKFDPVSAENYYAFQAFFAGVEYGDRPIKNQAVEDQKSKDLAKVEQHLKAIEHQLILLEPLASMDASDHSPRRAPIDHLGNVERFESIDARFIRFTVLATEDNNRHEPCLDELEIFRAGARSINVAHSSLGVKTSSSGNYSESGIHQLKHINEGLYGNSHSWISNEKGGGWVQFELPRIERIDRIIWSRDRTGQFKDRLPIEYRIEIADESGQWQTIAGSWDRIPIEHSEGVNIATTTRDRLQARKALLDKQKQLISRRNALEQAPMIYGGIFRKPEITHVLHRGDPEQPGQQVTPGLSPPLGDLELSPQHSGTERRVALARWISSPANPLTARVMVNRIWQFHFGRGLVDTPSDFGLNGAPPSHPALLDWLAAEFMESGWSIKHMHRLILHSRTYRQSSRVHQAGLAKDADMRLLWRFPGRRLEGEAIRDSLLQVSGKLNLEMTGPGFDFFKKRGGLDGYPPVSQFGAQGMKRMIYAHKVRMERVPVFGAFDCPDAGQPMSRRNQSTTAIQALNLFNSPFVQEQSKHLEKRVVSHCPPDASTADQIVMSFQLTLGRQPTQSELRGARELMDQESLATLCRVLINSSEFVYLP